MRFSLANYVIPSVVAQSGCALSWGANYAAATNADFGFNVEYLYGDSASSTTSAGGHANCPPGSKAGDLGCPGIQFCSNAATLPNSAVTIGLSNLVAGTQAPFARITILGIVLVCIFVTLRIRSALILSIIFATLIGINYGAPIGQGNSLHTAGLTHVDGVNYKAGTGLVECAWTELAGSNGRVLLCLLV